MRLSACLLLGLSLAVSAVGQTYVCVPDGNPTKGSGNAWPFDFYEASGRYMQILHAKHLSSLTGPYRITEVAFVMMGVSGAATFTAKEFQLRMSHTTLSNTRDSLFANWISPCPTELINVRNGFTYKVPGPDKWTDIGVRSYFAWDGKRDICLELRFRGQIYSQSGFSCRSDLSIPRIWANASNVDNFTATKGGYDIGSGLKVRLTIDGNNILLAPDTVPIGSKAAISLLNMPQSVSYQIAASLGQTPLPLGPFRLALTVDGVFITSVQHFSWIFQGYRGILSSRGTATAYFEAPRIPALVGIGVYHAAVAYTPSGIAAATNTAGTMIR